MWTNCQVSAEIIKILKDTGKEMVENWRLRNVVLRSRAFVFGFLFLCFLFLFFYFNYFCYLKNPRAVIIPFWFGFWMCLLQFTFLSCFFYLFILFWVILYGYKSPPNQRQFMWHLLYGNSNKNKSEIQYYVIKK